MRSFSLSVAAGALLALTTLTPVALHAETAADAPVACIALSGAAPAKLIPVCTAVIDDPATVGGRPSRCVNHARRRAA